MSMDGSSARDLAILQGAWEQVGLEEDGVVDPPDAHGTPGALTLIAGNEGTPRPTVFHTVPGQTMRSFVRRT